MLLFYSTLFKSRLCSPLIKYRSISILHPYDTSFNNIMCSMKFQHITEHRRYMLPKFLQHLPASGFDLPGQGLKKYRPKEEDENKSVVLKYLNRKIEEQEKGKKVFPLLPDYKFLIKALTYGFVVLYLIYLLLPDIKYSIYIGQHDPPCINPDYKSIRPESPLVYLYTALPLRFVSRLCGRLMNTNLSPILQPHIIKGYAKFFDAAIEESVECDVKHYKTLSAFFSRRIKPELRPINAETAVVSPSDGKVLISGKVKNGEVEQVKGVTYSLQKFLGPQSITDAKNEIPDFQKLTSMQYSKSLLHDPRNNDLYQCVIYLAPGDYHGFHSPANWVVKTRRHFPGELLSVNPNMATWIKNLFVLNERVTLFGEWKHGFFSMTAVGATMVGSIKIDGDLLLRSNQPMFKHGSYYDFDFPDQGMHLKKGNRVGEFQLGSSVVLVFEAPKNFQFDIESDQKIHYGEKLQKIDMN